MPRWVDDDTPRPKFKLRPRHALVLVDLAVIAGIFWASGAVYVNLKGTRLVEEKERERIAAQSENARLIEQADSVATAAQVRLQEITLEHGETIDDVRQLRDDLEAQVVRTQQVGQGIFRLSDIVLDLRERTQESTRTLRRYEKDVTGRSTEIDSLTVKAGKTSTELDQTREEKAKIDRDLAQARRAEAFDPKGRFPARTGVALRRDLGGEVDLTNVMLQRLLWNPGTVDVGVSLGFGLGTETDVSNKEVGLLLYRPLIHRRLGLDLGAGYTVLTEARGGEDTGTYASASLRLSPFYKERLHIGLGARAAHGEVVPFLGVAVGRR